MKMPLYAGKYVICAFLQNMRNMLQLHDRYKPVSLFDYNFNTTILTTPSVGMATIVFTGEIRFSQSTQSVKTAKGKNELFNCECIKYGLNEAHQ